MFVHCCHCTDCQRQTGSAFAINAIIEAAHIKSKGVTEDVGLPTDSGRPHIVSRCPVCKTALWSDYGGRRTMLFLRVGTLNDPAALPPDVHIFTRSKLPWVKLTGAQARAGATNPKAPAKGATTKKPARVCKVYYNMPKLWPAASLVRRAALGF